MNESILKDFYNGLKSVFDKHDEIIKSFTPKQRLLYNDHLKKIAILTKNRDWNGIEKLKEQFENQFNEAK